MDQFEPVWIGKQTTVTKSLLSYYLFAHDLILIKSQLKGQQSIIIR